MSVRLAAFMFKFGNLNRYARISVEKIFQFECGDIMIN